MTSLHEGSPVLDQAGQVVCLLAGDSLCEGVYADIGCTIGPRANQFCLNLQTPNGCDFGLISGGKCTHAATGMTCSVVNLIDNGWGECEETIPGEGCINVHCFGCTACWGKGDHCYGLEVQIPRGCMISRGAATMIYSYIMVVSVVLGSSAIIAGSAYAYKRLKRRGYSSIQ